MFGITSCLLILCFLSTAAQASDATRAPTTTQATSVVKITPKNVSDLYIGDLLRTKPKELESLETAGSAHRNVVSSRSYPSNSDTTGRSYDYKAHGGHEYIEREYSQPALHSSDNRYATSPRNVPVLGHLLTVKPIRVVSRDALSIARSTENHQKPGHYPNDDCAKSTDHSYDEKSYIPEERTYRRAKQVAPEHTIEYRSPQESYSEDDSSDGHSSHSEPFRGNYKSMTYPSNTNSKSHSSGSYTTSKSTSSSRTIKPGRSKEKTRIIPATVSYERDYKKGAGSNSGNEDIIVYKVKKNPTQSSENADREYSISGYRSKSGGSDSPYSQYSADIRKPRKPTERGHHSNSGQKTVIGRPQHYQVPATYGSTPINQERENYGQSPYTTSGDQRHEGPSNSAKSYHGEHDSAAHLDIRGYEQDKAHYKNYQNPESVNRYKTEEVRPNSRKKQRNTHQTTVPTTIRDHHRYNSREFSTQPYDYSSEHPIQSSRLRDEQAHLNYETYKHQEPHTDQQSQLYEKTHPELRPSEEKQMNQYNYETTPHQDNTMNNKKQYRESPRFIRSPAKYTKSVIVEGRSQLPSVRSEPLILVSRESKPHVSHSVSYSNSGFNEDQNIKPELNVHYREQPQKHNNPTIEERQSGGFDVNFQTTYKPFNSEFPASYANDPHDISQGHYHPQGYEQREPYEEPSSYEENPPEYHSLEEQPYENESDDSNYEDQDGVVKSNKGHHYISKVEGYRDKYSSSTPLHLDDAFFEKYGISKNAKVIVATAMKPNLFVADGTQVSEGGHSNQDGEHAEQVGEERFQPNFKEESKEDSYSESPEQLGVPREIPGSFEDLVNTNPKFLRQLPEIMRPMDSFFKMEDSTDSSFDEDNFRNADQKGFVMSQGLGEIVQQHGDGVSRIIFNVPKVGEGRTVSEDGSKQNGELIEAATKMLENVIKSDS